MSDATSPAALYRRYRPSRFGELVGQDAIASTLSAMVETDQSPHAFLFTGPRGCGKTSSARILAAALNCEASSGGEPCGTCLSCVAVATGRSLDVIEFDAASNSGVDAIRDVLRSVPLSTPGLRKVYIVDEVHQLSPAASNALLKTLEEPPPHVIWILATTEPHRVLATVRSRCSIFEFRLVGADQLRAHLEAVAADAKLDITPATLDSVARRAEGSVRDALSLLETAAYGVAPGDDFAAQLAESLVGDDTATPLRVVAKACNAGQDPRRLTEETVAILRDAFLCQMHADDLAAPTDRSGFSDLVGAGPRRVVSLIEALGDALISMRQGFDARVSLEVSAVRAVAHQTKS